jgi:hypothetical protein
MRHLLLITLVLTLINAITVDYHTISSGYWGSWYDYTFCPSGMAICGLNERITAPDGIKDDVAGNAIRFICCNLEVEMWGKD